jgi:Na+-driven multidrug efflux pump
MWTLVFLMIPLLILPTFFGTDSVWLSMPAAEVLGFLMAVIYFRKMKTVYNFC